jgi:hypothetical protein
MALAYKRPKAYVKKAKIKIIKKKKALENYKKVSKALLKNASI